MKRALLLAVVLLPLATFAQKIDLTFNDVTTGNLSPQNTAALATDKHKLDLTKSGWEKEALVIISGVPDAVTAQAIVLEYQGKTCAGTFAAGVLTFDVSKDPILKESKGIFDIKNNTTKAGKLQFEITWSNNNLGGDDKSGTLSSYIGLMASLNFVGNDKYLNNLTPIIPFGGIVTMIDREEDDWFGWDLDINPYLGAQIDTKDSISFIPAMMLPGRLGFMMNNYLHFGKGKTVLTFMPFGFGIKLIPGLKDSSTSIWQHNLRIGAVLRFADAFMLGAQYTHGFHNLTSSSQAFYTKVMGNTATDISYLTISGQFAIQSNKEETGNILFLEWRGLLNKKSYEAFTNNTIFTFGFRKDFSMSSILPVSANKVSSSKTLRTKPSF